MTTYLEVREKEMLVAINVFSIEKGSESTSWLLRICLTLHFKDAIVC